MENMKNRRFLILFILVSLFTLFSVANVYGSDNEIPDELESGTTETKKTKILGGNWLPVPIFITEPAVGYGFGIGLGYFHQRKSDAETASVSPEHRERQTAPPVHKGCPLFLKLGTRAQKWPAP